MGLRVYAPHLAVLERPALRIVKVNGFRVVEPDGEVNADRGRVDGDEAACEASFEGVAGVVVGGLDHGVVLWMSVSSLFLFLPFPSRHVGSGLLVRLAVLTDGWKWNWTVVPVGWPRTSLGEKTCSTPSPTSIFSTRCPPTGSFPGSLVVAFPAAFLNSLSPSPEALQPSVAVSRARREIYARVDNLEHPLPAAITLPAVDIHRRRSVEDDPPRHGRRTLRRHEAGREPAV